MMMMTRREFAVQSTSTSALPSMPLLVMMMMTSILMQSSVTSFGLYDDVSLGDADDVTSDVYSSRRTTTKWCRLCVRQGLLDSPSCRYCSDALDTVPPSSSTSAQSAGRRNMVLQLAERCCVALGISSCCQRRTSLLRVMEGGGKAGAGAAGVEKRGYETSFVPLEDLGNGLCSCCDVGTYNHFCCTNYCYGRK